MKRFSKLHPFVYLHTVEGVVYGMMACYETMKCFSLNIFVHSYTFLVVSSLELADVKSIMELDAMVHTCAYIET